MIDMELTWREAFAFADCHLTTDDAITFAHLYCRLIESAELGADDVWPTFSAILSEWRNGRRG
jgi:hypothetical protein